jgi:hypothetical protein
MVGGGRSRITRRRVFYPNPDNSRSKCRTALGKTVERVGDDYPFSNNFMSLAHKQNFGCKTSMNRALLARVSRLYRLVMKGNHQT